MSLLEKSEIIRTISDQFKTPNIYSANKNNFVDIVCENFRSLKQDVEMFLFFQHEGRIYFPIWFEFRSINNNLLFLFKEYEIKSFALLQSILNSSLQKEEKIQSQMKAIVYHSKNKPSYAIELEDFTIEESFRIDLFE